VQQVGSGARKAVSAFKGNNSAPAWSPDGSRLAVALSKDGLSQIYVVSANGGAATRLTRSSGIDTEPAWSPDGSTIIFTSDRGGSPQIYQMSAGGGGATRLTYSGSYNASAKFNPDGKSITLITRGSNGFQAAVMDLASRQVMPLSSSSRDDSPSFAPNGQFVMYESGSGGQGTLAIASSDGQVKQRLATRGDIRQPAWGPFPPR
jgi:TolB protein